MSCSPRASKARMPGASEGSKSSRNSVKMVTSRSGPASLAELARDAEARLVARLDADLDPVGLADFEPRPGERGRRLGRLLQQRRVARLVAADDEPLRLDPVRSGRPLPAHATRPTNTQPLCPPRPIAFERAMSTCTRRASFGT